MPIKQPDQRPHIVLVNTSAAQAFTAHSSNGGGSDPVPERDRSQHGASLQADLSNLKVLAKTALEFQREHEVKSGFGLQIQFESFPGVSLAFESLGNERGKPSKHIELLSVHSEAGVTFATVFVPDGKLVHFEKILTEYMRSKVDKNGNPRDRKDLINAIAHIRIAAVRGFWTDEPTLLPTDKNEQFWWEVWLPVRGRRGEVAADFRGFAKRASCKVSVHQIDFPERTVVHMYGSENQLSNSVMTLNCVAELRRAKETAAFFDGLAPQEQQEWVADAVGRLKLPPLGDDVPRVCLLDSGVNIGHPLLAPLLTAQDLHTVNEEWGVDDTANHGTGLAGLAAYGDLTDVLSSSDAIAVTHRLESVKLVSKDGANSGDATLHGYLFAEAVSRPEISAPHRPRVFASAVTAADGRERGRPSAWSAKVDALGADYDGGGKFPRLFVISAGNTVDPQAWGEYPESLSTSAIHDPGQAWNVLTVGAFTNKVTITESDAHHYQPVAKVGELSPYTTTSGSWDKDWALKPDVVFEGGNAGADAIGAIGMTSLNLLTTHNKPLDRLLMDFNATSAACGLAARMGAQLMAAYPSFRPETIRALICNSAAWTSGMMKQFMPMSKPNQSNHVGLIRHCGWGVPNIDRALWSAGHSLTMIIEDVLSPFQKVQGESITNRDMHLHKLPWPKEQLLALPAETQVELKITLSYFIEPNPSARGVGSKFHYPSHKLRFAVQRPLDSSTQDFVARINAAAIRDESEESSSAADTGWLLGDKQRHRGSLHQDVWRGSAAELANRGTIIVYPATGWWRTRQAQQRHDSSARYSLIVSITTPEVDIDLYTAIAEQVPIPIET